MCSQARCEAGLRSAVRERPLVFATGGADSYSLGYPLPEVLVQRALEPAPQRPRQQPT